jgi:disulfide bond formation protein DsbB
LVPGLTASRVLAACSLATLAAVGLSLVLQHGYGMQPCVWCVVQRFLYVVFALFAALGAWAVSGRAARIACILAADLTAALGLAAALFHQFVAARPGGCGITIADKFLMATSLHEFAPWIFNPSGPCDDANAPLLGVSFALWSATMFALLSVGAVLALVLELRERPAR